MREVDLVIEVGRESQRKGPEKEKESSAKECLTEKKSGDEQFSILNISKQILKITLYLRGSQRRRKRYGEI